MKTVNLGNKYLVSTVLIINGHRKSKVKSMYVTCDAVQADK